MFHTSSAGVKGGVDIGLVQIPGGTLVATTETDSNTGAYTLSGVAPGAYAILASKDGWTIPSLEVAVAAASLVNQNFTAEVTNWDVKNLGGLPGNVGANTYLLSGHLLGGRLYLVGMGVSGPVILYSGPTATGEVWTAASGLPTSEGFVGIATYPGTILPVVCDRMGALWWGTPETSSWNYLGSITNEALTSFFCLNLSSGSWETVTESGKVCITAAGSIIKDITPSGVTPIKAVYNNAFNGFVSGTNGALRRNPNIRTAVPGNWETIDLSVNEEIAALAVNGNASIVGSGQGSIWTSMDALIGSPSTPTYTLEVSGVPYSFTGSRMITFNVLGGSYIFGSNGLIMKRK